MQNKYLLLLVFQGLCFSLHAQITTLPAPIQYTIQTEQSIQPIPSLQWMIQEREVLTIDDVLKDNWKDAQLINIHPDETSIMPFNQYWYAVELHSNISIKDWIIFHEETAISLSFLKGYSHIEAYMTRGNQIVSTGWSGHEIANSKRDFDTHATMALHKLNIKHGDTVTLWFRLENYEVERVVPSLSLYDSSVIFPQFSKRAYFEPGFKIGIVIMLFFITCFLWFRAREQVYIWFMVALVTMFFAETFAARDEWLPTWVIPEKRQLSLRLVILIVIGIRVALLQFGRVLLELPVRHPRIDRAFIILIGFSLIFLIGIGLLVPRGHQLIWMIWSVGLSVYSLLSVLVCVRIFFLAGLLPKLYGFGVGLFFSTPILIDIFFRLGWQEYFHPDSLAPIGMYTTLLFALIYRFWNTEQEKAEQLQKINIASAKFVPTTFLNFLGKQNILEATLGDYVEKQVTILFSDIRDYTSLSEIMKPEENFRFVNAFNQRMGPIIQKHQGFVNQYLGDGLMAIFPENTDDTLRAAIEMHVILRKYNKERIAKGRVPLQMGIGLHAGPLIMGIIGDKQRMDAATISDTVNASSRVEGLTKHFGSNILITEAVVNKLRNRNAFNLRYLGLVQVKGKAQVMKIYECFDGDSEHQIELKKVTLADFEKGMKLYYNKMFAEAEKYFTKVVKKNKSDKSAVLFLEKINSLQLAELPADWNGVELMKIK